MGIAEHLIDNGTKTFDRALVGFKLGPFRSSHFSGGIFILPVRRTEHFTRIYMGGVLRR